MRTKTLWKLLAISIAGGACGCTTLANMPAVQEKLKLVSAGYTGCMPDENVLSDVAPNPDGSGTWNATCKGKTYLCSTIPTAHDSQTYHCAPVAQ